jgi:endonuclease YncB( thermonuclease family)
MFNRPEDHKVESVGGVAPTTTAPTAQSTIAASASPAASTTTHTPTTTIAPTTTVPPTTATPAMVVTHVVDGDTVDVTGGERVRLIGIDAPEAGQCGAGEASAALAAMVEGKPVALVAVPGRDDRDRYGRLLRYVQVGGTDAGMELIKAGLAIARYDSRDGYGGHPQEAAYIAADAATDSPVCPALAAPAPVAPAPVPPTGGGLDPRYPTCKAAKAAGYGPYTQGVDPEYDWYRDADSDGVVCE